MFELQEMIFEKELSRIELCNYVNHSLNNYKISVYRNHSFELVEHTINLYLDYGNIHADFLYSDYDDSMSFLNLDLSSDLIIVWIDFTRYVTEDTEAFVKERMEYLSSIYKKQILFIPFGSDMNIERVNVVTYNLGEIKSRLQNKFTDERLEPFSGTKLSPTALLAISKELGLKILPSCLIPPIKAVVFDLDNTLYKGVLGEEGYKDIELTQGHKKLQEKIVELSKQGFFICIASKNDAEDVTDMFKMRQDFPLQLEHITKICASWNPKSDAISDIQKYLNIGIKDILFVDDNVGEIVSVRAEHPDINVIWAKDDAFNTLEVLNNYPRMLKTKINYEDSIRQKDTQANAQREILKNNLSQEEFLRTLKMELKYSINVNSQIKRISELANKTNQFICSYKRYSEKEVQSLMENKDCIVIAVSLKDKLSDSGIIGVFVFKNKYDYVEVEEAFISCRALGRGIDENIVLYPIKLATEHFNIYQIKFELDYMLSFLCF